MPYSCDRMIEHHSRTGITHHPAYFLPHLWIVAVHLTFQTSGLALSKPAFVQSGKGIITEFPALRA